MSTYDPMFGVLPPSRDNEYVIVKIVVNPMADPRVKIFRREPPVSLLHLMTMVLLSEPERLDEGVLYAFDSVISHAQSGYAMIISPIFRIFDKAG